MTAKNETTPDELMESFKGRSLKSNVVFSVVVHAILLVGTSLPFLWKTVAGEDTSKMSEEERIKAAVREATASLRKIAEEHRVKPQDLSSQFAGGPRAPKPPAPGAAPPTGATPEPKEPENAIEGEINKVEVGPTVPPVEDEEEDLFK